MRPFHLGAIILAAGASSRMGQPKMLLPWGNTTVVGHLVDLWRQLGAKQVAVVCAAGDAALATELDRVGLPATDRISNPQPERGMFSSIRCAAAWEGWHADLTHWVVVLGDQPHLRLESLRPLIDFAAVHPESVCQPSWNGHGRHPVLLPKSVFRELAASEEANLKVALQKHNDRLCYLHLADAGFGLDIDRPADYQEALKLYFHKT